MARGVSRYLSTYYRIFKNLKIFFTKFNKTYFPFCIRGRMGAVNTSILPKNCLQIKILRKRREKIQGEMSNKVLYK